MCLMQRRAILASLAVAPLSLLGCSSGNDGGTSSGNTPNPPAGSSRVPLAGAGCYRPQYGGTQAGNIGCGISSTFGDPALDQQWLQELQIQAQFFSPVQASVYVLDECGPQQANALASPEGFILFGRYLASQLIQQTGTALPIAGVLAHEWGHRAQFTFGWMVRSEPTVRRTELEADMWSGLYMGLAKLWTGPLIQSFFQTLFATGDYNFHSPNHHGTPNQRYAAGATGLSLALQLLQTGQRLDYQQIHAIFLNEVARITATIQAAPEEQQLKDALARQVDKLPWPSQEIAARLDTDWIRGIVRGERSLDELRALPRIQEGQRLNLGPY